MNKKTVYQILAMVSMLLDHIGAVFYSDLIILRIIGRLAIPLYFYLFIQDSQNGNSTNDIEKLKRLIITFILSEIPYRLLFGVKGNIFLLLIPIHSFYSLSRIKNNKNSNEKIIYITGSIISILLYILYPGSTIGKLHTIFMILTIIILNKNSLWMLLSMLVVTYISNLLDVNNVRIFAFFGFIIIFILDSFKAKKEIIKPNKIYLYIYRHFYVLHLYVLFILKALKKA